MTSHTTPTDRAGRQRGRSRSAGLAVVGAAAGLLLATTTAIAPAAADKPVKGPTTTTATASYTCGTFSGLTLTTQRVSYQGVSLYAGQKIGVTVSPARTGEEIFLSASAGLNLMFASAPASHGFTFTAPTSTVYNLSFWMRKADGTMGDAVTWSFTCSTGSGGTTPTPTPAPAPADSDKDGVADSADICPSTALPEKGQRVAGKYSAAADRRFVDGAGKVSGITVADTGGCNAAQIAAKLKLSKQDSKGGITLATLTNWANTH